MSLQACFRDVDRFFKQFQSKISNPKVHIRSFEVWIQKQALVQQVHCLTRFAQLQRCHPKKIKCIRIGLQVLERLHKVPLCSVPSISSITPSFKNTITSNNERLNEMLSTFAWHFIGKDPGVVQHLRDLRLLPVAHC